MRKRNGFTLVEIISVIGILLIISAVAIPSIVSMNKRNKQKNYERIVDSIITSSENFIERYRSDIPFSNDKYYFRLNVLGALELIKLPITNPKTNEEISMDTCIEVIKNKDNTGTYDGTLSYNFAVEDSKCSAANDLKLELVQGNNLTIMKGVKINLKEYVTYSSTTTPKRYLKLNISGDVQTNTEGTYEVIYSVIDLLNGNNVSTTITFDVIYVPIFVDNSGANEPLLADGMIPVVYNEKKEVWVKANTEAGWYAYQDQIWANAVTTTSTNRATYLSDEHIGKEIPMDEINSMWVWIPRYKYNIASEYGIHSTGENGTKENPGLINVMFESEKNSSGSPYSEYKTSTTTKYYTHPAFRNGNAVYNESPYDIGGWDEEITGFWVAKFEGDNIKPDVKSRTTDYYAQFDAGLKFANGTRNPDDFTITFAIDTENEYGLNTTTNKTDTHMMKNTEWGAVAYLSQSRYGKSGNQSYSSTQKRIYPNNSQDAYADSEEWDYVYTGRSSGDTEAGILVGYAGYYSYNDYKCGKNQAKCNETPQLLKGTGASTTGTIYGIYDMRGGWDEALAAQVGSINSKNVLRFLNKIGPKYKDFYSNIYYNFYGVDETCGWYEENCGISSGFIRKASIFSRDSTTRLDLEHSFRVVLTETN